MTGAKRMFGVHACGCVSYMVRHDPADPSPTMLADFWRAVSERGLKVVETPPDAPMPPLDCPDPATCQAPMVQQARRRKRDKAAAAAETPFPGGQS